MPPISENSSSKKERKVQENLFRIPKFEDVDLMFNSEDESDDYKFPKSFVKEIVEEMIEKTEFEAEKLKNAVIKNNLEKEDDTNEFGEKNVEIYLNGDKFACENSPINPLNENKREDSCYGIEEYVDCSAEELYIEDYLEEIPDKNNINFKIFNLIYPFFNGECPLEEIQWKLSLKRSRILSCVQEFNDILEIVYHK